MSRNSKKSSIEATVINEIKKKRAENSWILFMKESLLEKDKFSIITIPHPANGKPAKYCLDDENKKIYEVITFHEHHRSWFIGETVKSDGSIMMMTPMNPIFLVLPRIREQCKTRAVPLEDLLSEKGFNNLITYNMHLENIGDLKGPADMKAYKYNEEKTLFWLKERVNKLAKILREKNVHVTSGAVSATFVVSNITNDNISDELYLKYAHGMVSEYLQDDLKEKLENSFCFKPDIIESVGNKRKSEVMENNSSNKKLKNDDECKENGLNSTNHGNIAATKEKTLTAKEKKRQKAASGTKTISSFFIKKS